MNKIANLNEAISKFSPGQTIMIGGFLGVGHQKK